MFKILIYLLPLIVFCNSNVATNTAKFFCNMKSACPGRTSVACQYTRDASIKCKGSVLTLPRLKITTWHNQKRNLVALGKVSGFKQANRMASMQWDKQLEQMAKYNVMTCKFKHDKCRKTNVFRYAGQNLYKLTNSRLSTTRVVQKAIESWYAEHKNCKMSIINKYRSPIGKKKYGHFSSMVKYNSNRIGCAASQFRKNGKRVVIVACNYASTNVVGRPIYLSGKAASKCKTGKNIGYAGLCKQKEDFSRTPFH